MIPDCPAAVTHRIRNLRFAVVGAYVADCLVATARLAAWGLEYEADSVRMAPGGKALNQAVALARLGARVTAIGTVGGDGLGQDIVSALAREGIDAGGMEVRAGAATPVCVCFASPAGETSFAWHIAEEVAVTPGTVRAAENAVRRADALLLTFELPAPAIGEAITLAHRCGTRVFVQPAPPLAGRGGYTAVPWHQVDVLVPNQAEALAILEAAGCDPGPRAGDLAAALAAELAVPAVVVTLGESGCVAHSCGASRRYPAHPAVPVDTTGASDAFAASLAASLVAGAPEADAVAAAAAAAAWAIGQRGGYESMPSAAQVAGMLSRRG